MVFLEEKIEMAIQGYPRYILVTSSLHTCKMNGTGKPGWKSVPHDGVWKAVEPSRDSLYFRDPDYTIYIGYGYEWFDFSEKQIKDFGVEPIFWAEKTPDDGKVFHFKTKEKSILHLALTLVGDELTAGDFFADTATVLGFKGLGPVARDLRKVLNISRRDITLSDLDVVVRYYKYHNKLIKAVMIDTEPEDIALYEF